jgi:hypothetical protein
MKLNNCAGQCSYVLVLTFDIAFIFGELAYYQFGEQM